MWLDHLLGLQNLARRQIDGAVIASVVPEANFNLRRLCREYCRTDPLIVGEPGVAIGTRSLVDRPEEVGADRLVNTVAAHDRYKGPLIVVDFGTATTFDVVDVDGNYCGGVIAPGINLSLQALAMAAAKLPSVPIARTEKVIGTSTVACMQSGIYWGYVGLVEGLVDRIKREFGAPMDVVSTGGPRAAVRRRDPGHQPCRSRSDLVGAPPDLSSKQQPMNHPPLQVGGPAGIPRRERALFCPARRRRARSG